VTVQAQRHANVSLLVSLAVVLLAGPLGCSKHALKPGFADAGSSREDANATTGTDAGTDTNAAAPDAGVADLPVPPDTANPADAPADVGGTDAAADSAGDACVPVSCTDEYGDSFCGTICDGCGHTLDCGETCLRAGWTCKDNVCTPAPAFCTSLLCADSSKQAEYCGDIGDGCGHTLPCPLVCPRAGWVCQDNMCVGRPDVCTPRTCAGGFYDYCGDVGDGCGGTLHCSATCPKKGWVCDNNTCVGPPDVCAKLTCQFPGADICLSPPQVGHYCGSIGDGCGGTLDCGNDCPPGWPCEDGICRGSALMCMPVECESPNGDTYCGTINNCCGGTTNCNPICPADWTCVDHLCVFGPGCARITCAPPGGGSYCGTIGDGCGGILDCPASCPNGDNCGEAHTCGTAAGGALAPPPRVPIPPPSGTWPETTPPPVPPLRAPSPPPPAARPAPTPPPC
jgi:hypothetical protein